MWFLKHDFREIYPVKLVSFTKGRNPDSKWKFIKWDIDSAQVLIIAAGRLQKVVKECTLSHDLTSRLAKKPFMAFRNNIYRPFFIKTGTYARYIENFNGMFFHLRKMNFWKKLDRRFFSYPHEINNSLQYLLVEYHFVRFLLYKSFFGVNSLKSKIETWSNLVEVWNTYPAVYK